MKKLLSVSVVLVLIWGCKEKAPFINYDESTKLVDSTFVESSVATPQAKTMLLEDVSGVKCVNCPDAAVVANGIMQAFPDRAFSIVMHPAIAALGSFVDPINKEGYVSKYDFRTKDAADILELVGIPGSLPRGLINRRMFSGKTSRLLGREEWNARAQEELQVPTPVNVELTSEYNEATGKGVVTVTLKYTQAITDKHYLTISLIEDSLVDVQEYQENVEPFAVKFNPAYVHMHVLRDVITSATGDPVTELQNALTPGRVFIKQYEYKTDVSDKIKVNPAHAKLIAFVHKDASGIDIVQAAETHVKTH